MKNILHCFCFFACFILKRHCKKGSLITRSRSFLKLMSCYLNKVILIDINAQNLFFCDMNGSLKND